MKNAISVLVALVLTVLVAGCASAQTSSAQPTPQSTVSVLDKVVQSLSAEADSGTLVEDLGNDAVLVHWHGSSDTAAHSQNLDSAYQTTITAMDQAANYEKAIWQADITGLTSVTVVIAYDNYQSVSGTVSAQDVAKAVVRSGTGTSLNWNSGSPAQLFEQFDVHWTIGGQSKEP